MTTAPAPSPFASTHVLATWATVLCVLAACLAGVGPARAQTSAPAATLSTELAHWLQLGRARPEQAITGLRSLLPRLAGNAAVEVEALVALGELHALLVDDTGVDELVEQLRRRGESTPNEARADAAPSPEKRWARIGADVVRARQLRTQGPVGRAERLLADALQTLPESTPAALRLRWWSAHAELLEQAGKFEPAARRYQEAIALADATQAPTWLRAELRAALAKTMYLAGQIEHARQWSQAALALARESGDARAQSVAYRVEGITVSDANLAENNPAAEEATRRSLEFARKAGATRDEIRATANLADMALRRGDFAQALAYSEQALPLARTVHDQSSESVALANAGFANIMLGQKDVGLHLAAASMAIDERAGAPAEVAATQEELGHYLEKAGHFREAYAAYSSFRRAADAVFRSDLQRKLSEMQESFDHERRRRALELLERENRMQQAQLVSRQLRQWLWAAAAALGALLLALATMLLRRLRVGNLKLAQTNAQLAQMSEHDGLTGLANRRGFQRAMQSVARIEGTLMLVDVDHFKQINDRWGHAVGDVVLIEVATRLRAALRADDLIVRWGGEEFVLWVPAATRAESEALVARTLAALANEPVHHGAERIPVTVSIGFATFPIEPQRLDLGWEQALELIDTAMYLAKAHGRNRAYGVRSANARTGQALSALAARFEAAWRDGEVELVAVGAATLAAA